MSLLHLTVLAIVQGITEFLPISSSAHLILVPAVTGWSDQGLVIDLAVHAGTLAAVLVYLRRDLAGMARGLRQARREKVSNPQSRLIVALAVATVPVVVVGGLLYAMMPEGWRSPTVIAWTTIAFALFLGVADHVCSRLRTLETAGLPRLAVIGLFQVLALIPGVSRSGITMTAGRLIGLERTEAARFSLLLSIPVTLAAVTAGFGGLTRIGDPRLWFDASLAMALAFGAAMIALSGMMAWLRRASFLPFILYRLVLGAVLIGAFG